MAERVNIVVPDGTTEKLEKKAAREGHTKSSLARKILLNGLKDQNCAHSVKVADGAGGWSCSKCGVPL